MAGTPNTSTYAPAPSNTMGLIGFLMTLLTCGALAPIGLIVSLIALRKSPRVMAVLGTVIGMLGVLGYVVTIYIVLLAKSGVTYVAAIAAVEQGVDRIKVYRDQHEGQLPDDIEGIKLVQDIQDPWKQPLRYEKTDNKFKIRSAGEDQQFDTKDDVVSQDFESDAELQLNVGTGDGAMDGPVVIPEDGSAPAVNLPADETPKEEAGKSDAEKDE